MDAVLNTLFLPLNQDAISKEDLGADIAFFNAQYDENLEDLRGAKLFLQQYFKPYADILESRGLTVSPLDYPAKASQSAVFILLPKNMIEARQLIGKAMECLKTGGLVFCAADNKAGGARLEKLLEESGFADVVSQSKNKARVAWGYKEKDSQVSGDADMQLVSLEREFWSWPGIFGWDKIDRGSEILLSQLPELKGTGADFGCGYGYLAMDVLEQNSGVKKLYCMDADARALECTKKNLEKFSNFETVWTDLTQALKYIKNLDFIVMNPPFHEGKKTDIGTGIDFIKNAHQALRKGGVLWMVANAHLPYEETLKSTFFSGEKKFEGLGFKIYCCTK